MDFAGCQGQRTQRGRVANDAEAAFARARVCVLGHGCLICVARKSMRSVRVVAAREGHGQSRLRLQRHGEREAESKESLEGGLHCAAWDYTRTYAPLLTTAVAVRAVLLSRLFVQPVKLLPVARPRAFPHEPPASTGRRKSLAEALDQEDIAIASAPVALFPMRNETGEIVEKSALRLPQPARGNAGIPRPYGARDLLYH